MLEAFFRTHDFMLEHAHLPIRRRLMDEIDWSRRLIAIKGGRGIGKTDFLLGRAREIETMDRQAREARLAIPHRGKVAEAKRPCLYVNINDLYFSEHSLFDFAGEFVREGGQVLLLDNVFKLPTWSRELRRCYDKYRGLNIIFAASPVMPLDEDNHDLEGIVEVYNLRGFSFREYLSLQTRREFKAYSLDDILHNHVAIASEICDTIHPLDYFKDYLHHGYYPSYLENTNFDNELLRTINMMLEVDILMIRQIEVASLYKLRKLLYIMLRQTPCALNISHCADSIQLSRATTMNYIKYLKDARLLNMLYQGERRFPMKPSRIFAQNTNIIHLINSEATDQDIYETYFYNVVHARHKVNATERNAMFIVDGQTLFDVKAGKPERDPIRPTAFGDLEIGRGNSIPLWLLGFLY